MARLTKEFDKPKTDLGKRLNAIWNEIHSWKPPETWRDFGQYTEKRALTEEEWAETKAAIASGFPATIVGHGWFGGVALIVYEPANSVYPGDEAEAVPVLQITGYQIPGNNPDHQKPQAFDPSVERPTRGGVWDVFTALCNAEANLALLKRENIDPPQSIGHYQY